MPEFYFKLAILVSQAYRILWVWEMAKVMLPASKLKLIRIYVAVYIIIMVPNCNNMTGALAL